MKTKYQFITLLMLLLPLSSMAQPYQSEKARFTVNNTQQLQRLNLSAVMENNQLFLSGNFENDKLYEVRLYNALGHKVYSKSFEGTAKDQHFSINDNLGSGKYTVAVRLKSNIAPEKSVSML